MLKLAKLLSIMLVTILLCACSQPIKDDKPLIIWCNASNESNLRSAIAYMNAVTQGGFKAKIVPLPKPESPELENDLKLLRTQIMAGDGPDLFVVNAYELFLVETFLFEDINKTARAGIFADLQQYFKNDKELAEQKYITEVFDAGLINKKRFIIPLSYVFEGYIQEENKPESINALPASASLEAFINEVDKNELFYAGMSIASNYAWFEQSPFNYDNSTLNFDKAAFELGCNMIVKNHVLADKAYKSDNADNMPSITNMRAKINDKHTIIPLANNKGTITPSVTSCAMVYAKSTKKDEAIQVIKLLLSEDIQANKGLSHNGKTYIGKGTLFFGLCGENTILSGIHPDARIVALESRLCKAVFLSKGHAILDNYITQEWLKEVRTPGEFNFEEIYKNVCADLEKYIAE